MDSNIIVCYFKLRSKQLFRMLKELGIVRSLFLSGILFLACCLLIKAKQSWIVPAVVILGLIGYHNERKDKDFLLQHAKDVISLFRLEYLLIGTPFLVIECMKARFVEAGVIIAAIVLLPKLKTMKWKSITFPLPFLYKGGVEYFRMFRLYGWLYFLLFLIALAGALHGNIRIGKVALIVWGILQTTAFTSIPQRQELTFFLDYQTFQKYLIQSTMWNATITGIPLAGIILSFSFCWENILFSVSAILGSTFCLWNLGMMRYLFSSVVSIAVYLLIVLIPLFFYTCFIPFLLIPFALLNGICYTLLKNNSKKIWN